MEVGLQGFRKVLDRLICRMRYEWPDAHTNFFSLVPRGGFAMQLSPLLLYTTFGQS